MTFCIEEAILLDTLTITRATGDVPKASSPSSCRDRSRDVFTTFWAFREVNSAITIIVPEAMRKYQGVFAEPIKEVIRYVSGLTVPGWDVISMYDENPAKGTPIKLTKSFPAKARANANVPRSTTILKTFIRNQ